jgi:ethanolamine permease
MCTQLTVVHYLLPLDTSDSTEKIVNKYLERRKTPQYQAGKWQLCGLGIGAVIAGEFSGWNFGIATAGYKGFWVSNVLAALLYINLALCLAELACAIPVVGGTTAFCRAVFGNITGYFIGYIELFGYLCFMTFVCISICDLISHQTGLSDESWPIIWLIMLIITYIIVAHYNELSWKLICILAMVCLLEIFAFVLYAMSVADESNLYVGWPQDTEPNTGWGLGGIGIIQGVFSAAWWYTGFECVVHATKETSKPIKNIPFALIVSSLTFLLCAIFLTYFNVVVPPGAGILSASVFPMNDALIAATGGKHESAWVWILYPNLVLALLAYSWCSSRQSWALSRVGYMPQAISVTSEKGVPRRGVAYGCILTYILLLILFAFIQRGALDYGKVVTVSLDIILLCALTTYSWAAITYIGFTLFFPDAPRPFKNPFGIYSAGFLLFISVLVALVKIMTNGSTALVVILIYFVVNSFYFFFMQKMHLIPTEESLMKQFWEEYREY